MLLGEWLDVTDDFDYAVVAEDVTWQGRMSSWQMHGIPN